MQRVKQAADNLAAVQTQYDQLQTLVGQSREEAAEKRTVNAQLKKESAAKIDWRRLTPKQREGVFAELDSGRLLPAAAHPVP